MPPRATASLRPSRGAVAMGALREAAGEQRRRRSGERVGVAASHGEEYVESRKEFGIVSGA